MPNLMLPQGLAERHEPWRQQIAGGNRLRSAEPQEARETRLQPLVCEWHICQGSEPCWQWMSWRELERLVRDAERQPPLRQALRGCSNQAELLLRARCRGYRVTRVDLQLAWQEHEQEQRLRLQQTSGKGGRATC
jgi:Nif11 domain